VARLELVSTQYAHRLIDALEDTLLAILMGDRFANFTVGDMAPLRKTLPAYTPTVDRKFSIWGLNCRMVDLSDLTDYILPPAYKMARAITDSLNYHLNTTKGRNVLHAMRSNLTALGINVTSFPTGAPHLPTPEKWS
jgi:hypothetical protein